MIEAAIVLGVVGLIIGGIWVASASYYENYRVNKTVEGMLTLIRNTQKLFSMSDAFATSDNTSVYSVLMKAGAIPKDWIKNGNVKNPYGGVIGLQLRNHADRPRIDFCLQNIPSKACVQISVRLTSLASASSTKSYYTGTNVSWFAVQDSDGTTTQTWTSSAFPLSIDDVSTACNHEDIVRTCIAFGLTRIN